MSTGTPRRATRTLAALTVVATVLGLATSGPGASAAGPSAVAPVAQSAQSAQSAEAASAKPPRKRVQPPGTTVFQLSSFNLLGSGHTDGNGPRKGFADSGPRLTIAKSVIDERGLDVIGFQEMHDKQVAMWTSRYSSTWGLYPAAKLGTAAGHNSITWRRDTFALVQSRYLAMPYFKGEVYKMPYVLLRHRASRQLVWVSNVHLPANTHGNAQKWRNEGIRRQAALIKRLREQNPRIPVLLTGDMNDREKFVCPMLRSAPVRAANGGYADAKVCEPPPGMSVDWIVGTPDASFTGYVALDDARVDQASDHPMIIANVHVPTPRRRTSAVRNVVVVAVDGLRSDAVRLPAAEVPWLTSLRERGASTLNARTAPESTLPLPNLTSILTGRPVATSAEGHGVTADADTGSTVHAGAGRYVSSVFDMAHNNGLRTGFYSAQPRTAMLVRTWNEAGGRDPYGRDNGTAKFSRLGSGADDDAVTTGVVNDLRSTTPPALSVVELSGPEVAGLAHGFGSAQYRAAVGRTDALIGQVVRAARTGQRVRGKTLVLVVGTSGGEGSTNTESARYGSYRVPLFATGPGVAAGGKIYQLNPGWRDPAGGRGSYRAGGPLLVGSVANLALGALRLPALPGSVLNSRQDLSVWAK